MQHSDYKARTFSIAAAMALVGFSFGALSVSRGMPIWVVTALALMVFSGGAELLAVTLMMAGSSPAILLFSCLLLNSRFFPLGFAVGDLFGNSFWKKIIASQLVVDETVAIALSESTKKRQAQAYWFSAVVLLLVWPASVFLGGLTGGSYINAYSYGIDVALPIAILLLIIPALKTKKLIVAVLSSALLVCLFDSILPGGVAILLAPIIAAIFYLPSKLKKS